MKWHCYPACTAAHHRLELAQSLLLSLNCCVCYMKVFLYQHVMTNLKGGRLYLQVKLENFDEIFDDFKYRNVAPLKSVFMHIYIYTVI